jgi:hypothetical protein
MPPRRSARVAAVAERASSVLSPLPPSLVLHVFSLLPADARARAACVCRAWHTTLLEPSLWTRLSFSSPSSGVTCAVTETALAGAAAKARGRLQALDVSGCDAITLDDLLPVLRANAGALRELCYDGCEDDLEPSLNVARFESLLAAAPQLAVCHANLALAEDEVRDGLHGVGRMLRNEPPFQAVRTSSLWATFPWDEGADEAPVLALAADLAAHASLRRVKLTEAPLGSAAALDAVVDAALARQLVSAHFSHCRLSPASAPALARLLGGGTLTELIIVGQKSQNLLDGPSAALLGAALRANSTLTTLALAWAGVFNADAGGVELLGALTGHASVRSLHFSHNAPDDDDLPAGAAVGAALGALVAANAPSLTELDVSFCHLGDDGMRALFAALPANTHLRTLNGMFNSTTVAFAGEVVLPAVRANASLCKLSVANGMFRERTPLEAAAKLVRHRARAAAGGSAAGSEDSSDADAEADSDVDSGLQADD